MAFAGLSSLNDEQRAAVLHRGSPLLLLAGAGSGKTRVITFRIGSLVAEGVDPHSILGVTFTNKAAEEMRARVRDLVRDDPEAARAVTLSTFHSLGVRILREAGERVGVSPTFSILDAEDQRQVLRGVLLEHDVDPDLLDPAVAQVRISAAKNAGTPPEELRANARSYTEKLLADVMKRYQVVLQAQRALDFDDLLRLPVLLLTKHADVRERFAARFQHILVDEYQDSNPIQLRLVQLLAGEGRNLVVVGDDDQSIYGWRGACLDNILDFEHHFPGATVMALTRNYRSTGRVLALADAVIRGARRRREKRLWTSGEEGPEVRVVSCADPREEARFLAMEMDGLRKEHRLGWGDIGVLCRTNSQFRTLEEVFREDSIPYRIIGGMAFFERREVKDVLAYLRILVNPGEEIALRRALATPSRGIGPASLNRLSEAARVRSDTLFESLARADKIQGLAPRIARIALEFVGLIRRYGDEMANTTDIGEVARRLVAETRIRDAILQGEGGRKPASARAQIANIESLMAHLDAYAAAHEAPSLRDYLQRVTLDAGERDQDDGGQKVTIMTLHASKGLEFPAVFLAGVEDGLLPHGRSVEENAGDDDEERRLFYVGITRARRWLTLTHCRIRKRFDGDVECRPSPFLDGIPEELALQTDRPRGGEVTSRGEAAQRFAAMRALMDDLDGPQK